MTDKKNNGSNQKEEQPQSRFSIIRVYVKDASFEAPNLLEVLNQKAKPSVSIDYQHHSKNIDQENGLYEVTLMLTASVKQDDDIAFISEVHQSGLFEIIGVPADQLDPILQITCANILFPYAREMIDNLITKASLPPLMLQPMNFENIYRQNQEKNKKQEEKQTKQ